MVWFLFLWGFIISNSYATIIGDTRPFLACHDFHHMYYFSHKLQVSRPFLTTNNSITLEFVEYFNHFLILPLHSNTPLTWFLLSVFWIINTFFLDWIESVSDSTTSFSCQENICEEVKQSLKEDEMTGITDSWQTNHKTMSYRVSLLLT